EAGLVPVRPLVVVEQRPYEVADDRHATADRARHLPQVEHEVEPAVAVAGRRDAVLADEDRQFVACVAPQELAEALRIELPAERAAFADVLRLLVEAGIAEQAGQVEAGVADEVARVVVDADEVERL